MSLIDKIHQCKLENPTWGFKRIARHVGVSHYMARYHLNQAFRERRKTNDFTKRHAVKLKLIQSLGGKCNRCGFDHPAALDFHHSDPIMKTFTIGRNGSKSFEKLLSETMKCTLLCSNCHRIEHASRYH